MGCSFCQGEAEPSGIEGIQSEIRFILHLERVEKKCRETHIGDDFPYLTWSIISSHGK